jgi:ATP-dependent protease ClpP protease subunit
MSVFSNYMEYYSMENKENKENEKVKEEIQEKKDEKIKSTGQITLDKNKNNNKIHLISIIGEIEGHESLGPNTKTTKYEHVLPTMASIEDSNEVDGVLIIINTVGGDVESGLAIAEMIASLSKPTVSLVLGGSHSIGVPLAVATDYSFIVPSGTMIIHPVRVNGLVIGVPQTFDYFKIIQDRILNFIVTHCKTNEKRLEKLMMETGVLTKDVGTILVGKDAVYEGLIDEVGGIKDALRKLHEMVDNDKKKVEN